MIAVILDVPTCYYKIFWVIVCYIITIPTRRKNRGSTDGLGVSKRNIDIDVQSNICECFVGYLIEKQHEIFNAAITSESY